MNLYEKIVKEASTKVFDPDAFEKEIPHNMRYKTFDEGNGYLYWVTQCPFNKDELYQFATALRHTPFTEAYVTVRDLSGYDYYHDKGKGVLAHINGGNIDATDYVESMKADFADWDYEGAPYKSLAERKQEQEA